MPIHEAPHPWSVIRVDCAEEGVIEDQIEAAASPAQGIGDHDRSAAGFHERAQLGFERCGVVERSDHPSRAGQRGRIVTPPSAWHQRPPDLSTSQGRVDRELSIEFGVCSSEIPRDDAEFVAGRPGVR